MPVWAVVVVVVVVVRGSLILQIPWVSEAPLQLSFRPQSVLVLLVGVSVNPSC